MRKTLPAFVLLLLCPVAVAGADEYEEHANDASPADGPPEDPGNPREDATTTQNADAQMVAPPPCWPHC